MRFPPFSRELLRARAAHAGWIHMLRVRCPRTPEALRLNGVRLSIEVFIMRNCIAALVILALPLALSVGHAGKKTAASEDAKEALQQLQEFIGGWKGAGTS